MKVCDKDMWSQFLLLVEKRCTKAEYANWFSPIKVLEASSELIKLEVPNIFVREYLMDNYKEDMLSFLPQKANGELSVEFIIKETRKTPPPQVEPTPSPTTTETKEDFQNQELKLNSQYTFVNFIEGPSNQFIKSAAMGIAIKPGKSYNPLFVHGGVGLGKTHLLHGIGHYIKENHKKLRVQCITTECFINDLVQNLRNKTIDKMKRFYRNLDVLLVDDIQFLENKVNFEEEFCNTFESLINQSKQIVITSDKPPGQLNLSERLIARMEWGLVAQVGIPDLETRVAILQHKADQKGVRLPNKIAFFIAEHIYNNVRQLEGAVNRLGAYCRMMSEDVTQDVVEHTLGGMFQTPPSQKISVEGILSSVSSMFNVRVSDLKGNSRSREIAFPRQVAMYLAKEMISDSLMKIASSFGGKTHSTLLHACKKISKQLESDTKLRRQVQMTRNNLES